MDPIESTAAGDPGAEPAVVDATAALTDPAPSTDPAASADPAPTDPNPAVAALTEPARTDAAPTDTSPADGDPALAGGVPAPVEQAPADEATSEPAVAGPSSGEEPAAEPVEPTSTAGADAPAAGDSGEAGETGDSGETGEAMTASGLRSGQIVEGKVVAVDASEVVVELGDGTIGVIGKRHLTTDGRLDPTQLLAVGDGVEAAVLVRDDPKGRTVLSRAWALKQRAWERVEAAKASRAPLTGKVTGLVKGGLVVDVGTRAFLPASQVDLQHVADLASFVGNEIEALVHELDRVNDKIVLSRRNLLRSQQRALANDFAATLAPGQVHRGRVSLLTDFGAFVEIGGVRGLVHLSELAWSRVERAADVVNPGDEVDVKVLGIKPGKKLSLSIRAVTPDPLATLQAGQVLTGVVTRLADFGAFVRVGDGAEGLVHVTELAEYRVHAPEEVVAPGDEVLVKVIRIDRKRRRLDLSVNQAVLS
jgi:small subunit ribosomal protein S1